jgi:hypothetical protein
MKSQVPSEPPSDVAEIRSYKDHLLFDHVLSPENATGRDRYEALARLVSGGS